MNFGDLQSRVRLQGGFDTSGANVSTTDVAVWVNERYQRLVTEARWREEQVSLGSTVAGQSSYALPANVDRVVAVSVGDPGQEYLLVGPREMWKLRNGDTWLGAGTVGAWAPGYDASGTLSVDLFQTPDSSGSPVRALVSAQPDVLTNAADVPIVPVQFHRALVEGAIATGLADVDERLGEADRYEARFEAAVEKLRRLKNSREQAGPIQIRVAGFHF